MKDGEEMTSEFGKGFIYNLFLFAKHWWRMQNHIKVWAEMRAKNPDLFTEEDAVSLWFNGAADHFFELEIPEKWKDHEIGRTALQLQNRALEWRLNELGNKKDFDKFFDDLEKLCRLIDKELGVEAIEAQWN